MQRQGFFLAVSMNVLFTCSKLSISSPSGDVLSNNWNEKMKLKLKHKDIKFQQ